jgi:hypothetical protein
MYHCTYLLYIFRINQGNSERLREMISLRNSWKLEFQVFKLGKWSCKSSLDREWRGYLGVIYRALNCWSQPDNPFGIWAPGRVLMQESSVLGTELGTGGSPQTPNTADCSHSATDLQPFFIPATELQDRGISRKKTRGPGSES